MNERRFFKKGRYEVNISGRDMIKGIAYSAAAAVIFAVGVIVGGNISKDDVSIDNTMITEEE